MNHLANAKLALAKWLTVRPEDVAPGLRSWRCGTQACFGGHLATWPEFRLMGITCDPYNYSPQMPETLWPDEVAEILFGDATLFILRRGRETGTDHEVVIKRLQQRIEELC